MSRRRTLLVLATLFGTGSCGSPRPDAARVSFARSETCPVARVALSELEVPPLRELVLRSAPPPADIEEDPARLELWVVSHTEWWMREDPRLFAVEGCNVRSEIACYRRPIGPTRCRTLTSHRELPPETEEALRRADRALAETRRALCDAPFSDRTFCDTKR